MILIADRDGEIIELGLDFTFESAYDFIAENDTDFDKPWLDGFDIILVDGDKRYVFESASWFEIEGN